MWKLNSNVYYAITNYLQEGTYAEPEEITLFELIQIFRTGPNNKAGSTDEINIETLNKLPLESIQYLLAIF
ncbi:hypothetical protein PR048_007308 [Dryococelus australis]|uniref:Uncharacterized protein n=1 Tax=Dryococelus australis TaxID=614101 RepID=A0ABQ9IDA2_9NEOP|nr:hypothetical protein PR048_007308 [Dryococelus australis]